MIRVFSSDPEVIAVGEEYLRIVSWNFVASGVVFVELEHVPGDGQHDAVADGVVRCASLLVAIPAFLLSRHARLPAALDLVSWPSARSALQMVLSLLLLRREFATRLAFTTPASPSLEPQPAVVPGGRLSVEPYAGRTSKCSVSDRSSLTKTSSRY